MVDDQDISDILGGISTEDSDLKALKKHVEELGFRFDSVQIFATRHEPDSGGTVNCNFGSGNWYARYGHVQMWVKYQQACEANNLSKGV
jgi:hypothetical protein